MTKFKQYLIVLTTSFLFLYMFGLDNIFNSLSKYFLTNLDMSPMVLGFLSSLLFYANIFFLIPAGLIVDRYSLKWLALIIMLICSTATLLMGISNNIIFMSIERFVMGICSAFGFSICMKVASIISDKDSLSKSSGIIVIMGMLGGVMAQTPLTELINYTSWQTALICLGVGGYVIGIGVFTLLSFTKLEQQFTINKIAILRALREIFSSYKNILYATYASLINLPLYMLGAMWGIPYLTTVGHFSQIEAANVSSMLFLGMMVGSPLVGILADWLKNIKILIVTGAFISLLIFLAITKVPMTYYTEMTLFFLLGAIIATHILIYPLIITINPKSLSATSTSLVSMACLLGGAIIQPLFGFILDNLSTNHIITSNSYIAAIQCLLVSFALALIMSIFISKENI